MIGIGRYMIDWNKDKKREIFKKTFPSIFLTIIMTILIFSFYHSYNFIGMIGIKLGFWIISNNFILLIKKNRNYSKGMMIAHLGIGLLILGITGSSNWQEEKIKILKVNKSTQFNDYNILFKEINEIKGPNYVAIEGNFTVHDKNKNYITSLKPQNRYYPITKTFTTEASIHTNLSRDLYLVLGEGNLNDGWVVKIYHNPLVIWIWIGALIIFTGGIVSTRNNFKKIKI